MFTENWNPYSTDRNNVNWNTFMLKYKIPESNGQINCCTVVILYPFQRLRC